MRDSSLLAQYKANGEKWAARIKPFPDLWKAFQVEKDRLVKTLANKKLAYETAVELFLPKVVEREEREKARAESGGVVYLFDYDRFEGKPRVNLRGSIEWVLENLYARDAERHAPSKAALTYLMLLRDAEPGYVLENFYMNFGSRLLPSRAELDKEDQLRDDGGGVDRTLQLIEDTARRSLEAA